MKWKPWIKFLLFYSDFANTWFPLAIYLENMEKAKIYEFPRQSKKHLQVWAKKNIHILRKAFLKQCKQRGKIIVRPENLSTGQVSTLGRVLIITRLILRVVKLHILTVDIFNTLKIPLWFGFNFARLVATWSLI